MALWSHTRYQGEGVVPEWYLKGKNPYSKMGVYFGANEKGL